MRNNVRRISVTVVLIFFVVSGLTAFTAPAAASTTTYAGTGSPRSLQESADRLYSGSASSNGTAFQPTLPGVGWGGYQLATTFSGITRYADFVANGQFTSSSSPWGYTENDPGNALAGPSNYVSSPPYPGTTTGSDYITLTGKTNVTNTYIINGNFTTSETPWVKKTVPSSTTYGTYSNGRITGDEWEQRGTYTRYSGNPAAVYADMYCDQNFTYNGLTPPQYADISWKSWVPTYTKIADPTILHIQIILRYFPTGSTETDYTILDVTPTTTSSKPAGVSTYDITSKMTSTGKYGIRLWVYVYMTVTVGSQATLAARWDDVGVYIRYGAFSSGSYAQWGQTVNFNQIAADNGLLSFRYYTTLSTIVPSTDSYLSVWVGANRYDNRSFSSLTANSWQIATTVIPASVFNQSAVQIKVGVYIGTNLLIPIGTNPNFYFDNVSFYLKYKATPASIRLRVFDDANSKPWYVMTGSAGSGSLTFNPSTPWTGLGSPYPQVTFHFWTNGTNGKPGYNSSIVSFSYSSTTYARHGTQTTSVTFTVSDDSRTSWTCTYDTPDDINSYNNYNITVYFPPDWLLAPTYGINQITFGGISVTTYSTASNATASWVKMPGSVFAPNPPIRLLVIQIYAPNYIGPSQLRTLLFTQGENETHWMNATSFISGNTTRLICLLRDGSGGIPSNIASYAPTIRLYNESGGSYLSRTWSPSLSPGNGSFSLKLNPWVDSNVTWFDGINLQATFWRFCVNWNSTNQAANGIARFTTNSTLSRLTPTSLTSPKQPFTATFSDGFKLVVMYTNSRNSSGIMGANVIWRWNGTHTGEGNWSASSMSSLGIRGNYTVDIAGPTAYLHFAPQGTWIQVNATLGGFVPQSIFVRVFVRDIATTGSSAGFSIAQTYAWNSTVSVVQLVYTDIDHGFGISGAILSINGTWGGGKQLGSSGIGWWYSDMGAGTYQLFFRTNTTSLGTSSWFLIIEANKTHYQSLSVNLGYLNVRDRYTTHTEPYLSVTTAWGDNVTFLITFRDIDSGHTPIFGASATCNWANGYSVATPFGNGTYRFSLSIAGLSPQTINVAFDLSRPHWDSITGIAAQVTVRNIHTDLSSTPAQISVYWRDNSTAILIYKDLDHTGSISNISNCLWDHVKLYDKQTGAINYTGSFIYNMRLDSTHGSWILTLNGSLPVGDYTLWLHVRVQTANGYYEDKWLYPTLSILPIATNLAVKSDAGLYVYWNDLGNIVINYTDTVHGGKPILGASIGVTFYTVNPDVIWNFTENGNGLYTVFFNTTSVILGTSNYRAYPLIVLIVKGNHTYATTPPLIGLEIMYVNRISTKIVPTLPQSIVKGSNATYTVRYSDTDHADKGIPNANITLIDSHTLLGIDHSHYTVSYVGDGTYAINLETGWISSNGIDFIISASATNYFTQSQTIPLRFQTGGFSLMTIMMIGGGSAGAVLIGILGVVFYRRSKIPFVIKKIDQSVKLITKGEMLQPVPMRTRTEIVGTIFQDRLTILSKEKMEELEKEAVKGQKAAEESALPQEVVTGEEQGAVEESAGTEPSETDVDLIAKELERLEGKGGKEPSGEAESSKESSEEREETKKKKGDYADL
ncbi:MAG: hypothetical protein WED04_00825 [Promethearchaeati archaeon SRVP18_Atabeyarchaeia-1]